MSSVTVCNCPQNTPDPACFLVVSYRPVRTAREKARRPYVRAEPVAWDGDLMAECRRWRKTVSETGVQWLVRYRGACMLATGRRVCPLL